MKKNLSSQANTKSRLAMGIILWGIVFGFTSLAMGAEINDKLSLSTTIAGAYQYQDASGTQISAKGRGGLSIIPEISYRPADKIEFFAKFGFGSGNGLNKVNPFVLTPWAANLEDDVKNINGRNRDYLLTAWVKRNFKISESISLGITGGLIDATAYLDSNAYANDENTQFMNSALVNGSNGFFPSFDIGGATELTYGNFNLNGVVMNMGENDDGNNYNYYGIQMAYRLESSLGEGNFRLILDTTSKEFQNQDNSAKKRLECVIISMDQQLGDIFGVWIRTGISEDLAVVATKNILSGGIDISGKLWDRENDNIGIGTAFLNGGNTDLDKIWLLESYVRFALDEYLALTLDVQYIKDQYDSSDNPKGFVYGLRFTAEF